MLLRGIPYRNAMAHRGGWVKTASGSYEVRGKCLGIVGYGHIGTQIGLLAEALGMQVVYYDVETKLALGNALAMPSLDALLQVADVVTLHVPETPQTFQMIGAAELAPRGIRVNAVSPGPISTPFHSKLGLSERELKEAGATIEAQVPTISE